MKQLQAKLTGAEKASIDQRPTSDLRAYELYLKARDLVLAPQTMSTLGVEKQREGVQLLTEAIARDPNFYRAYTLLAHFHDALYWFGGDPTPARLALAQDALDRAERLRPDGPLMHLARARHLYWGSRDYERASREINEATRRLPNDDDALVLRGFIDRREGRFADAIANLTRATETNPANLNTWLELSETYAFLDQPREYFRVRDQIEARAPGDPGVRINRLLTGNFALLGDPRPLRELMENYRRADPTVYQQYAVNAFVAALSLRDAPAARHAIDALPASGGVWYNFQYPREFFVGLYEQYFGDRQKAAAAFQAARRELEFRLKQSPDDPKAIMVAAETDAFLGQHEAAMREARRALDLLPPQKDAIDGARMAAAFARVAALGPNREQALAAFQVCRRVSGRVLLRQPAPPPGMGSSAQRARLCPGAGAARAQGTGELIPIRDAALRSTGLSQLMGEPCADATSSRSRWICCSGLFAYSSSEIRQLRPRYNIAPTTKIPVVRCGVDGKRELVEMRWGLIPAWAKDPKTLPPMINARSESIASKPSFRTAYKSRRCLIPASGYYEWQKRGAGPKQPFYFHARDDQPLAFAGLWEHWSPPEGEAVTSAAIVTCAANAEFASIHDRMPVILVDAKARDHWLAQGPLEEPLAASDPGSGAGRRA